jgi:hypothetical protein
VPVADAFSWVSFCLKMVQKSVTRKIAVAPMNAASSDSLSFKSPLTSSTPLAAWFLADLDSGLRVTPRTFQPPRLRNVVATDEPFVMSASSDLVVKISYSPAFL